MLKEKNHQPTSETNCLFSSPIGQTHHVDALKLNSSSCLIPIFLQSWHSFVCFASVSMIEKVSAGEVFERTVSVRLGKRAVGMQSLNKRPDRSERFQLYLNGKIVSDCLS